jgi:hypothetical protein
MLDDGVDLGDVQQGFPEGERHVLVDFHEQTVASPRGGRAIGTGRPQAEVARPVHRRYLQEHNVGVDVLGEELGHGAEGSRHVVDRTCAARP